MNKFLILFLFVFLYVALTSDAEPSEARESIYKFVRCMPLSIWSGPGDVNGAYEDDCKGYQLYTGKYSRQKDDDTARECYKGALNQSGEPDDVRDMQLRMQYVEDAFDKAKETQSNDSSCLNIFLLPEFFFRGVRGGYKITDMLTDDAEEHPIEKYLLAPMKAMALANKDWLFVFGTIIIYQIEEDGRVHVNNISPVIYRNTRLMVCKSHVSTIDFLTINDSGDHVLANPTSHAMRMRSELYNVADVAGAHHFAARMGFQVAYNTFCIQGIKFGLDICLDHAYGMVKKRAAYPAGAYAGDGSVKNGAGDVDVHLIVSAGMSIMPENVATKHGMVFICDGEGNVDTSKSVAVSGIQCAKKDGGKNDIYLIDERVIHNEDYSSLFGLSFYSQKESKQIGMSEPVVRTYASTMLP